MTIFPTTKSFLKNFMKHQIHHLRLMSPTFCLKAKTTSDLPPPPSPSIQSLLTFLNRYCSPPFKTVLKAKHKALSENILLIPFVLLAFKVIQVLTISFYNLKQWPC